MTAGPEHPPEIAAELARLRKLEHGLRAERNRIRAGAAEEVLQLQTALREASARAAQREREVQRLAGELKKAAVRPSRLRRGDVQGRLRRGRADSADTGALERVLATFERERQKLEERARAVAQTETRQRAAEAGLQAARTELAELERLSRGADEGEGEHEIQERIAAMLARREAEVERREQERVIREHAGLREEISAREAELARREEEVARREIQLSLVRRRIAAEERRLQERTWRTGAQRPSARSAALAHRPRDVTFSEGWRLLAGRHRPGPGDEGGGSW